MTCKRFTHFVDYADGNGGYRDTNDMSTALTWHRAARRETGLERSWVQEYDPATGDDLGLLASWNSDKATSGSYFVNFPKP